MVLNRRTIADRRDIRQQQAVEVSPSFHRLDGNVRDTTNRDAKDS